MARRRRITVMYVYGGTHRRTGTGTEQQVFIKFWSYQSTFRTSSSRVSLLLSHFQSYEHRDKEHIFEYFGAQFIETLIV